MKTEMEMRGGLEVKIIEIWDGANKDTSQLAELELTFFDLDKGLETAAIDSPEMTANTVSHEVHELASKHFPSIPIQVHVSKVEAGSLTVGVILIAGGATYKFVKDYPEFKAGVKELAADISKAGSKLKRMLKQAFGS